MIYGLWQSAGGLLAQDYRQSILANNLANVDTPGFKPDCISFQERLNAAQARGVFAGPNEFAAMAGGELGDWQRHVSTTAGIVGARPASIRSRLQHTQDAVSATSILLSQLQDVDFTEAVTRFQQAKTALQATLLGSARLQNLSLLDFLR